MAYIRKTVDRRDIMGNYGYGWECESGWGDGEKWYLTKDNNTGDNWAECIWCNTISHDSIIEYNDNGEPICPECKRAGAMKKL
jgi:hypothetical protein